MTTKDSASLAKPAEAKDDPNLGELMRKRKARHERQNERVKRTVKSLEKREAIMAEQLERAEENAAEW